MDSSPLFDADTRNDSLSEDDVSIDVNQLVIDSNSNNSMDNTPIDEFTLTKVISFIHTIASKDSHMTFGFAIILDNKRIIPIDNSFRRSPTGITDIGALLGTAYDWDKYIEFVKRKLSTYSYLNLRCLLLEIQLNMSDWTSSTYPVIAQKLIDHIDFMVNYKLLSSLHKS